MLDAVFVSATDLLLFTREGYSKFVTAFFEKLYFGNWHCVIGCEVGRALGSQYLAGR